MKRNYSVFQIAIFGDKKKKKTPIAMKDFFVNKKGR